MKGGYFMTTMHSIERAKERIGANKKTAEHIMRNALERGKDKTMFTCEQKRQWLIAKESAAGCKALVYNNTCFIVSPDNIVITLYQLPGWFSKNPRYAGKDKIRNLAKYTKLNRQEFETQQLM